MGSFIAEAFLVIRVKNGFCGEANALSKDSFDKQSTNCFSVDTVWQYKAASSDGPGTPADAGISALGRRGP